MPKASLPNMDFEGSSVRPSPRRPDPDRVLITGISKKLVLAIETVLDVAYFTDDGRRPIQSGAIPSLQPISRRYLEAILQELVRAGILESVRGPRGGYRLGRAPTDVTLADIAIIVQPTEKTDGLFKDPFPASDRNFVRSLMIEIAGEWGQQLEKITIGDLCSRARRAGIDAELP